MRHDITAAEIVKLRSSKARDAGSKLIGYASSDNPSIRYQSILGLGLRSEAKAMDTIQSHLRNDDSEKVRGISAVALGYFDDGGYDSLVTALDDSSEFVVTCVITTLVSRKEKRAAATLLAMLGDQRWKIRLAVCEALVQLRVVNQSVIDVLEALLYSDEGTEYNAGVNVLRARSVGVSQQSNDMDVLQTINEVLADAIDLHSTSNP